MNVKIWSCTSDTVCVSNVFVLLSLVLLGCTGVTLPTLPPYRDSGLSWTLAREFARPTHNWRSAEGGEERPGSLSMWWLLQNDANLPSSSCLRCSGAVSPLRPEELRGLFHGDSPAG